MRAEEGLIRLFGFLLCVVIAVITITITVWATHGYAAVISNHNEQHAASNSARQIMWDQNCVKVWETRKKQYTVEETEDGRIVMRANEIEFSCLEWKEEPPVEEPPVEEPILKALYESIEGSEPDVLIVPHEEKYALSSGTLEMIVTPSNVASRQGLVSKDASGFGSGGHMSVYMTNDDLEIRVQSASSETELRVTNAFKDNEATKVVISFGADGLYIYVNDELANSNTSWTGGLEGNAEPWVIGALQWGSSGESADKIESVFKGSIELKLIGGESGGDSGSDPYTASASVSWVPPMEREDGAKLNSTEICCYRVYSRLTGETKYKLLAEVTKLGVQIELESGEYELVVTTVDTGGIESKFSEMKTLVI